MNAGNCPSQMKKMKTLNELDYEHWCKEVKKSSPKVYKDEVCFMQDGIDVCIKKSDLNPSPVEIVVGEQQ